MIKKCPVLNDTRGIRRDAVVNISVAVDAQTRRMSAHPRHRTPPPRGTVTRAAVAAKDRSLTADG